MRNKVYGLEVFTRGLQGSCHESLSRWLCGPVRRYILFHLDTAVLEENSGGVKMLTGPHFPARGIVGWFGGVVASAQQKTVWKPAQPSSIKPTIQVTSAFESRLVAIL